MPSADNSGTVPITMRRHARKATTAPGSERDAPAGLPRSGTRWAAALALLAVLVFVAIIRLGAAATPLERDEGEYAYAGQLILQGTPPYQAAFNMKFPGTYYAYAAIMAVFGETPAGIRHGLLLVNAATIVFVYLIGRRWLGVRSAVVAAWVFGLLSLTPRILGLFGHATHFVLLPLMAALWIVADRAPATWRRALAVGVLTGLAVLMKQHAIVFVPGVAAFVMGRDWRSSGPGVRHLLSAGLVLAGALATFAVLCAVLAVQGVLGAFWFWTIDYARAYVSVVPRSEAFGNFAEAWSAVTDSTLPLWTGGGVGLVLLWTARWPAEARVFLTGLAAASLGAIIPGFYFREHYFILLLPAVALLSGVAVETMSRWRWRVLPHGLAGGVAILLVAACSALFIVTNRAVLFAAAPDDVSRLVYRSAYFADARQVALLIRDATAPGDQIAVFGSEPEIYFYSDRRAATAYIYTYGLMEAQPYAARMQDEMIRQVDAAHPKYLVAVLHPTSWLIHKESQRRILEWIPRYVDACYDRVDAVGLSGPADAFQVYRWKSDNPCHAGS